MASKDMAVRISAEHYKAISMAANRTRRSIKTTIEICIDGFLSKEEKAFVFTQQMANRRNISCKQMKNKLEKQGVINKEK